MPRNAPDETRLRPGGTDPPGSSVHVYGGVPPFSFKATPSGDPPYCEPTLPNGRFASVPSLIGVTTILNRRRPSLVPSVARTTNEYVPSATGVPLSNPVEDRAMPEGSAAGS